MLIRSALPADVPQIMEIISGVVPAMNAAGNFQWDSTYPNARVFEQDIALNQLWIAEINDQIAGVAAITNCNEPEYAALGWDTDQAAVVTHRLAVNRKHRGKGIAAALLAHAEKLAVSWDIHVLHIDTSSNNAATQALFPKMGYLFAGEISLSLRPGQRFYCYEKRLGYDDHF